MELSTAKITTGLSSMAVPTGTNVSGNPTIGDRGPTLTLYPLANRVAAAKVTSAATGNVATMTLSTGVIAQTTGSPVILDGDGKDWEGVSLATIDKLHGIRLRTPVTNTGNVTTTKSGALIPGIDLAPGSDLVLALPVAGLTVSAATLIATFAAANDVLTIEFLAKA